MGTIEGLYKVLLTENEEISEGVFVLSIKRQYNFIAGQVIKIGLDNINPPRIYSICSGTDDENISVLFNIKEGGYLTPKLASLIPGDEIFISKPYGSFTGSKDKAWWIATGTGIAPFHSMFRSEQHENKTLIHGARFLNQFYFEDDLEWAMGERYIRCCSKEQSCDVFSGRVNDYLNSLKEIPTNIKFYLCGQALMVVEVRDLLIQKGVPFENIIAEIYF